MSASARAEMASISFLMKILRVVQNMTRGKTLTTKLRRKNPKLSFTVA